MARRGRPPDFPEKSGPMSRLITVMALVAVLVGGGITDALVSRGPAPASEIRPPIAYALGAQTAESAEWTCPAGSGPGGAAVAHVVVTNPTGRVLEGTLEAVSSDGHSVSAPLSVPPGGQASAVPASLISGAFVGAMVVLDGGGGAVSETLGMPAAWGTMACASTPSSVWYFAAGSTASNRRLDLYLMDPGATSALVNLSFATPNGSVAPASLQGISVPAGGLVVVDVSRHISPQPEVATSVKAISGDVIAAETESPGQNGAPGLAAWLGATAPSTAWYLPSTADTRGSAVSLLIYNPESRPARVRLLFHGPDGLTASLAQQIGPHSIHRVSLTKDHAIPSDLPFSTTLLSTDGVGVVVERSVTANPEAPSPRFGASPALALAADRWIVPSISVPGSAPWRLTVMDLAGRPVDMSVMAPTITAAVGKAGALLAPVPTLTDIRIRPGKPFSTVVNPGFPIGDLPLQVLASGPVGVSLQALPAGSPGVVEVPCFPAGR